MAFNKELKSHTGAVECFNPLLQIKRTLTVVHHSDLQRNVFKCI